VQILYHQITSHNHKMQHLGQKNAPPPHVQPINLSQPPNVRALNLNPPSIVHTSQDPEVIIVQNNLQDDMGNQKLTTEVVQAQLLEVKMEQKRQNDIQEALIIKQEDL